jgi:hypothetical protein
MKQRERQRERQRDQEKGKEGGDLTDEHQTDIYILSCHNNVKFRFEFERLG